MNHDYAHCADFTEKCPKSCFRAQLVRDLKQNAMQYIGVPMSYMFMRGTTMCPITKKKLENLIGGKMEVDDADSD